jgi:hypothetical protein
MRLNIAWSGLMRCKSLLRQEQKMPSAVACAQEWAKAIVQRESRGPGDLENAMRRIERRYGVPYSVLWACRYRPPKDMQVSVWLKLQAAYVAECERQERLLKHERETVEATNAVSSALLRAAARVAGENN